MAASTFVMMALIHVVQMDVINVLKNCTMSTVDLAELVSMNSQNYMRLILTLRFAWSIVLLVSQLLPMVNAVVQVS
jgi:hypothetical protein